jgi:hypothetical protein
MGPHGLLQGWLYLYLNNNHNNLITIIMDCVASRKTSSFNNNFVSQYGQPILPANVIRSFGGTWRLHLQSQSKPNKKIKASTKAQIQHTTKIFGDFRDGLAVIIIIIIIIIIIKKT